MPAVKRKLTGLIETVHKPPRMVIYGPPGIGKTTLGVDAPGCVFLPTEDGVPAQNQDGIRVPQFPVARTWPDFVARLIDVSETDHEFKTFVIDTLNGAADLCKHHVCATEYHSDFGPKGFANFNRGWETTLTEIIKVFPILDACRDRGMTVLLLAHTGVVSVKNPVAGDYEKFIPDINKKLWPPFSAWADIILRAEFDMSVKVENGKTTVASDSVRKLIASGSAVEDAKTRVGYHLPATLPMSWASIAEHLGHDTRTAQDVRRLWDSLDAKQIEKTLAYLGIKDIEQIEAAQSSRARVVLNRLKTLNRNESEVDDA